MALSPPLSLTRSPSSSSIAYCRSEPSALDYPSPPDLVEQQYKLSTIYGSGQRCSMTPPMDSDSSLPPLDALCQQEWTGTTLLHSSSSTGAAIPSISSSDYDSFEGYDGALPQPYGHDIYQSHNGGQSSTPPPTGLISKSPGPSSRPTVSYTSAPSVSASLTPRIKLEHAPGDYGQGLEGSQYPSPRSMHASYATDSGSYAGSASGYLSDGQSSWRTSEYQPSVDANQYYGNPGAPTPFMQDARRPYRVARPRRAPRRLTTREEANFQCDVKGCGKLFSRSYNFKAHMETHDEKREYPFPCMADDCNKKFVRKTDLQRHHQSVHMKERNHKCDYCSRLFARKDTLRRHMEDGCSKRFDIGTLDIGSENYEASQSNGTQLGIGPLSHLGPPPGGLPPMTMPPFGTHGSILTPTVPSTRNDRDSAADQGQAHSWGR